jgi:hypothetical protein
MGLTKSNSGVRDFWLQAFQRQVRLSSDVVDDVTLIWGVSEVVLVTDVVDLDSLPLLLLSNDAADWSKTRRDIGVGFWLRGESIQPMMLRRQTVDEAKALGSDLNLPRMI